MAVICFETVNPNLGTTLCLSGVGIHTQKDTHNINGVHDYMSNTLTFLSTEWRTQWNISSYGGMAMSSVLGLESSLLFQSCWNTSVGSQSLGRGQVREEKREWRKVEVLAHLLLSHFSSGAVCMYITYIDNGVWLNLCWVTISIAV